MFRFVSSPFVSSPVLLCALPADSSIPIAFAKLTASLQDLVPPSMVLAEIGTSVAGSANGVEPSGPTESSTSGGCSRSSGDDRGGWRKEKMICLQP